MGEAQKNRHVKSQPLWTGFKKKEVFYEKGICFMLYTIKDKYEENMIKI